jgi:hypothetical protein
MGILLPAELVPTDTAAHFDMYTYCIGNSLTNHLFFSCIPVYSTTLFMANHSASISSPLVPRCYWINIKRSIICLRFLLLPLLHHPRFIWIIYILIIIIGKPEPRNVHGGIHLSRYGFNTFIIFLSWSQHNQSHRKTWWLYRHFFRLLELLNFGTECWTHIVIVQSPSLDGII